MAPPMESGPCVVDDARPLLCSRIEWHNGCQVRRMMSSSPMPPQIAEIIATLKQHSEVPIGHDGLEQLIFKSKDAILRLSLLSKLVRRGDKGAERERPFYPSGPEIAAKAAQQRGHDQHVRLERPADLQGKVCGIKRSQGIVRLMRIGATGSASSRPRSTEAGQTGPPGPSFHCCTSHRG
jgi:hypothetical protein